MVVTPPGALADGTRGIQAQIKLTLPGRQPLPRGRDL